MIMPFESSYPRKDASFVDPSLHPDLFPNTAAWRAQRETKDRFHLLMECLKDHAIILLSAQGQVTGWNAGAKRFFGYDETEIVGKHYSCLFAADDIGDGLPEMELHMARVEGRAEIEHWQVRQDGSCFWASSITTPMSNGKPHGYVKVLQDRTKTNMEREALFESEKQARKLAEELEARDRRKDDFLAMLGHELRSPLAPLLNAVQLLQLKESIDPDKVRLCNLIERQVRQLARLISDLREVSQLSLNKLTLCKKPSDLNQVVQHAIETVESLMVASKHHLDVSLPKESITIQGDPVRLEQIVVNLLVNAAKYTPDGGMITFCLHEEDGRAILRVRDTGIGIEPDLLPRIFDWYTQSEPCHERSRGGLGIGLALVRHFVEMHDGTVEARSPGSGQGCEFIVCMPIGSVPK